MLRTSHSLILVVSLSLLTACSGVEDEVLQHTLTIRTQGEGIVDPAVGEHVYHSATLVPLEATPAEGWRFSHWVGEVDDAHEARTSTLLDKDKTVDVVFERQGYDLTIEILGKGTVVQEVVSRDNSNDSRLTVVRLEAIPEEGWEFIQWEGDLDGYINPVEMPLDRDKSVTVVFLPEGSSYAVSGWVGLDDGTPLSDVMITFSREHSPVHTDADGFFEKRGLTKSVKVSPEAGSIGFTPNFHAVDGPMDDCNFVGIADYGVQFHDGVRIVSRDEMESVVAVDARGITFSYAPGFAVDEILVFNARSADNPILPQEGLLRRVTSISDEGLTIGTEDALLVDAIQSGDIRFGKTYPLNAVMSQIRETGAGQVYRALLEREVVIDVELVDNVRAVGALSLTTDLDLEGNVSFSEGLEHFEFAISPGLEVDISLIAETDVTFEKEVELATWQGLPIVIFPGVFFVPRVDFIVGANCEVAIGLEMSVSYERSLRAGVAYSEGKWSSIGEWGGSGHSVQPPELDGSATAEIYAGVKLSGSVYGAVGLYAGPYLYADAEANVNVTPLEPQEWEWDYRLGLGLKMAAGAELSVLRIARLSIDLVEANLFHTNIAYGVSGRVLNALGQGIAGIEILFDGDENALVVSDEDGYWHKHLLSGQVKVTARGAGYGFDSKELLVDGPTSDLAFVAAYEVAGCVFDEDGLPIANVRIMFDPPSEAVQTAGDGCWGKQGFHGEVTVSANREGYFFHPPQIELDGPTEEANFISGEGIPGTRNSHHAVGATFHMRLAPAAQYPRGSPQTPVRVQVEQVFWIAETELTYDLWYGMRRWAEARGYVFANLGREGYRDSEVGGSPTHSRNLPVTTISFYDALVWTNALSEYKSLPPVYWHEDEVLKDATDVEEGWNIEQREVNGFRILTRDEWELAARYQGADSSHGAQEYWREPGVYWTPSDYPSGGTVRAQNNPGPTGLAAWFIHNTGGPHHDTQDVGQKPVTGNHLGLYDMSGNVKEWTFDGYIHLGAHDHRVALGGSFRGQEWDVTASSTTWHWAEWYDVEIAIRLGRSPLMIER